MNNAKDRKFFKKNIGKEFTFSAKFVHKCTHTKLKGLLVNVMVGNKEVADHVWTMLGQNINTFVKDDIISFKGTFYTYNKRGGVRQYGITNISNVMLQSEHESLSVETHDRKNKYNRVYR